MPTGWCRTSSFRKKAEMSSQRAYRPKAAAEFLESQTSSRTDSPRLEPWKLPILLPPKRTTNPKSFALLICWTNWHRQTFSPLGTIDLIFQGCINTIEWYIIPQQLHTAVWGLPIPDFISRYPIIRQWWLVSMDRAQGLEVSPACHPLTSESHPSFLFLQLLLLKRCLKGSGSGGPQPLNRMSRMEI